jgi:hypothetical protein
MTTATDGHRRWPQLPPELLGQIAEKTRDVADGVTLFRLVCRLWRAAVHASPRLFLPLPERDYALVYPLARGWSAVVDVHDSRYLLPPLPPHIGATATLPN